MFGFFCPCPAVIINETYPLNLFYSRCTQIRFSTRPEDRKKRKKGNYPGLGFLKIKFSIDFNV